jgi:hypothetical protein
MIHSVYGVAFRPQKKGARTATRLQYVGWVGLRYFAMILCHSYLPSQIKSVRKCAADIEVVSAIR